MNVEVSRDEVVILQESNEPHENEYNITECHFTFDDFTDSFQVKRAIFTVLSTNEMYETDIINNKCNIPVEVLKHEYETVKLGVYGYNIGDNEELLNRFSPSYATFVVPTGSYEEGALSPEIITPSQYDIYSQALQEGLQEVDDKLDEVVQTVDEKLDEVDETMQQVTTDVTNKLNEVDETMRQVTTDVTEKLDEVDDKLNEVDTKVDEKIDEVDNKITEVNASIAQTNNLNLDVSDKVDGDVTVTLTKKDASTKTVILSDGTSLQFDWDGTKLGIKTDDEQKYTYVDLQGIQGPVGPQGEPFRIKKTYPSVSAMNADFNNMEYGDYVMIASSVEIEDNAKLYTRGEVAWIFITDFSGATGIRGETGLTPNIQIGTVVSGSTPNVTRTGTNENPIFNFTLVKGDTGPVGPTGPTGNGIASIEKTSTSGLVDTYTITFTNTNTTTFNVTNGNGIDRIEKTNTVDNVDTYTIYFTNGSTTTYEVTNGEVTEAELQAEVERLEMIYNAFPTVSDEDNEIQLNNTAKVTFKELGLKGDTSQEVIPEEQGTSVSNTSIYVSDVNTDKENTIEMSGNTYQANTILPSEYTQVDYIESNGTQYIDTGVNADSKLRLVIDLAMLNDPAFGAIKNVNSTYTRYHFQQGGTYFRLYSGSNGRDLGTFDNNRHYFDFNVPTGHLYMDGNEYLRTVDEFDTGINFHFFRRNSNDVNLITYNQQKLYSSKMYYDSVLVRDLIPCYRNSDNEVGLYDLVNNVFYTNQGTGTFTYGSVVGIPNPDYPQNIEVVTGNNNVKVVGKNLFDNITTKQLITSDGTITNNNSWNLGDYIKVKPSTQYTFSRFDGTGQSLIIGEYNKNKEYIQRDVQGGTTAITPYTITTTATTEYIRLNYDNTKNNTMLQLEQGSTATTYEAYTGTTYPVNLGNIELCKINTYQDRIYKQNDKWYSYKEIGKFALNGTETVTRKATSVTDCYSFSINLGSNIYITDNTQENAPFYCNKFVSGSRGKAWYLGNCIYPSNSSFSYGSFGIYYDATKEMTTTQFQNWLSQNGVVVYYPYATPTTTEITDTTLVNQLNALYNAQLHSTTHIDTETSNLLPYIDLHYNFVTPSPSPSRPSQVNVVKGNNTITISNSDNTESQSYPINLPTGMELCKIGTYQDYIYESNGNWFKKGNIDKVVFNGSETENWSLSEISSSYETTRFRMPKTDGVEFNAYFNNFMNRTSTSGAGDYEYGYITSNYIYISINRNRLNENTTTDFKNWLSQNNVIMYYSLNTPTDTQITDTTLIAQLNNIKKAYSYDTQTNISQTNTDKPFIIYAEAIRSLKDIFQEVNNG